MRLYHYVALIFVSVFVLWGMQWGNIYFSSVSNSSAAAVLLSQQTPAIVKNIKTDFGAVCNGVADDSTAFSAFNTWAKQWQASTTGGLIELDIPSGSTCIFGNGASGRWTVGVKKMLLKGYGATMKGNSFLGGYGIAGDLNHHAYANSASAGATSIVLKTPSNTSKFTVGNWVVLTGFDLQGFWNGAGYGYPPNAEYFDYLQVTAIDAVSGRITFAQPLKYDYKDTWPQYDFGGRFGNPEGGPPTLYALDPSWDTEVEYDGITFDFTGGQTYSNGRIVVFKDIKVINGSLIPTQNLSWSAINSDLTVSFMEADKLVTTMSLENSKLGSVVFQSSSIDLFTMDNSEITRFIHGTPKKFVANNSTFKDLFVGTLWYGRTDEFICTNCVVTGTFGNYGFNVDTSKFSMANGVITVPNTESSQVWAIPGTNAFWSGAQATEGAFKVIGVTQDANNTYVQTNLTGGWPDLPKYQGTAPLKILANSAPKFTCTNCSGNATVADLSQAPAGAPLYSYSKRTYSGNLKVQSGPTVRGKIVSIKINVTKPYSGTKPTLIAEALGQFGLFVINPDGSTSRPDPRINLKIAGERVITPATTTGLKTGDDFTASWGTPVWKTWDVWINGYGIAVPDLASEDSSTWPTFTIEVITDQGVGSGSGTPQPTPTPVITTPPPVVTPPVTTPPPTTTTNTNTNTQTNTQTQTQTQSQTPSQNVYSDLIMPTNIYTSIDTSGKVALSWTPSSDSRVTSYNIYRGSTKIGTVSGTSFTDAGTLLSGTNYQYGISASDGSGRESIQATKVASTLPGGNTSPSVASGSAGGTTATKLATGTKVKVVGGVNVRTAANGTKVGSQTAGRTGTIVGGSQTAGGYIWWKVDYDTGADGWSAQDYISPTSVTTNTSSVNSNSTRSTPHFFTKGARVKTRVETTVRALANGTYLGAQPTGSSGTIVSVPVYINGSIWWRVDFDNWIDGWSTEKSLQVVW